MRFSRRNLVRQIVLFPVGITVAVLAAALIPGYDPPVSYIGAGLIGLGWGTFLARACPILKYR